MGQHEHIIEIICTIRQSFVGAVTVYTSGSCYQFHKILKTIFPQAEPVQDRGGHIVSQVDGRMYDITGEVMLRQYRPVDPEEAKRLNEHKYVVHVPDMMELNDTHELPTDVLTRY